MQAVWDNRAATPDYMQFCTAAKVELGVAATGGGSYYDR